MIIERWRIEYNRSGPRSSLGYRPPVPEAFFKTFIVKNMPEMISSPREVHTHGRLTQHVVHGLEAGQHQAADQGWSKSVLTSKEVVVLHRNAHLHWKWQPMTGFFDRKAEAATGQTLSKLFPLSGFCPRAFFSAREIKRSDLTISRTRFFQRGCDPSQLGASFQEERAGSSRYRRCGKPNVSSGILE